jgi:hypothetical protein
MAEISEKQMKDRAKAKLQGRPPHLVEVTQVQMRISGEDKTKLRALAKDKHMNMSEYVTWIIVTHSKALSSGGETDSVKIKEMAESRDQTQADFMAFLIDVAWKRFQKENK